jgi:DNA polymerase I-like protein with 3'-5' exonuclease and polymerase domains
MNPKIAVIKSHRKFEELLPGSGFFLGYENKLFNRLLKQSGIKLLDVVFINLFTNPKEKPKDLYKKHNNSFDLTPLAHDHIEKLNNKLNTQYKSVKVLIPLDDISLFAISGRPKILDAWAGSFIKTGDWGAFPLYHAEYIIPNYHPSFLKKVYKFQFLAKRWLKRVKMVIDGRYTPTKRWLIMEPNFKQVMEYLAWIEFEKRAAYDIETIPDTPIMSCIAFSHKLHAICIPFFTMKKSKVIQYFTEKEEIQIFRKIKSILENPEIQKIGHNLIFDNQVVQEVYNIDVKNFFCTMIAQNMIMGDFRKGLNYSCAIFTDLEYYKDEGKGFIPEDGYWRRFWRYNALDAAACDEIHPKQLKIIKKYNNLQSYNEQVFLNYSLKKMNISGVRVHKKLLLKIRADLQKQLVEENTKLLEMVQEFCCEAGLSKDEIAFFNSKFQGSKPQLERFFNKVVKAKKYKTKQKKYGFDELALSYLARDGWPVAKKIVKIRGLKKKISTYYNPKKLNKNNRLCCHFNAAGTRFVRLSSSRSIIDGSGMNLQNLPSTFKELILWDRGKIGFEIDLSQAEKLCTIYQANSRAFIEHYESGGCLHCLTAESVLDIPWREVLEMAQNGNSAPRKTGKMNNFAWDYGRSYFAYSLENSIPLSEAKKHWVKYFSKNPEIKSNFWKKAQDDLKNGGLVRTLRGFNVKFHSNPHDSATHRQAYNALSQTPVGQIINEFGMNFIERHPEDFHGLEIKSQVHDALFFQCDLSLGWEKIAEMILKIINSMEVTNKCDNGNEFVIPCDLKILPVCFSEGKKNEFGREYKRKDIPNDAKELGRLIEKEYKRVTEGIKNTDYEKII